MGIIGKVRRNPIKNDKNAISVHPVYKVHEVLGGAETACRGKVAGNLIAPGASIGILGDGHNFNMGIAHLKKIGSKSVRYFSVIGKAPAVISPP